MYLSRLSWGKCTTGRSVMRSLDMEVRPPCQRGFGGTRGLSMPDPVRAAERTARCRDGNQSYFSFFFFPTPPPLYFPSGWQRRHVADLNASERTLWSDPGQ